jgi:uncharacterized protein YcfJ
MTNFIKTATTLLVVLAGTQASAQVTFYEHDNFQGQSFTTSQPVDNLGRRGFNDRASSVVVIGGRWEVCEDSRFRGNCVVLRRGSYNSLQLMNLNDRVSSTRPIARNARVNDDRFAPEPVPVYDDRRRQDERLYQANISSVRAVVGNDGQRCWTEREQVVQNQDNKVGGAIAGALIGGILGHQVGGGAGKDLATVGGAVAGAAVGSNLGRNSSGQQVTTQDVQRCATDPGQVRAAYWDVRYTFRGQEHRVQLTRAPGPTITVNAQGEPRN